MQHRFRRRLRLPVAAGALQQQDQRRHPAALAALRQPGLAALVDGRSATTGGATSAAPIARARRRSRPAESADAAKHANKVRLALDRGPSGPHRQSRSAVRRPGQARTSTSASCSTSVIARYQDISPAPRPHTCRGWWFPAKAASAYHMAKLVIRLINDVARGDQRDPRVGMTG